MRTLLLILGVIVALIAVLATVVLVIGSRLPRSTLPHDRFA
jgi:hypothetical protein